MRLVWLPVAAVALLGGCPGGDSGDETLGLPCTCDDGSSSCDTDAICGGLTCVARVCSKECDLGLQDCPDDAYCTVVTDEVLGVPVAGAWCRPVPACLEAAGLDEDSLLMATGEVVGEPCSASSLGDASIEGQAFGASLPSSSQHALAHALELDSTFGTMIHIGADIAVEQVSGQCTMSLGDVALTITLPCGALRLGPHEIGAGTEEEATLVEVLTPIDEGLAVSGTVAIDGYDPATGALCGSLDVTFNDGEEGRMIGTFQAATPCY